MKKIVIKKATANNLKGIDLEIPLEGLVGIVGPSGSGKSSLIEGVLFNEENRKQFVQSKLPGIQHLSQRVVLPRNSRLSLGEYNLKRLDRKLKQLNPGELLIVDEPCAGMTEQEAKGVVERLRKVANAGVSVLVVEHAREVIKEMNYLIEFGPGSGRYGGEVVFQGVSSEFKKSGTLTSRCVFEGAKIEIKRAPNDKSQKFSKLESGITGVNHRNLKNFGFKFPLASLDCIFGPIGTGKTALLDAAYRSFFKGKNAWKIRADFEKAAVNKNHVRRSYLVEQSPISKNPRSFVGTYMGFWDEIRNVFADLPEAKKSKLTKSDFSLNTPSHQKNKRKVEAARFSKKSIFDVLGMTMDEAWDLFKENALISRKINFLREVGLGYLVVGQPAASLSGGEAQRVRLAKVLSKKLSDRCLYILDTPSRGLHLSDLESLLKTFYGIIDKNNTILIADNKKELINKADFAFEVKELSKKQN